LPLQLRELVFAFKDKHNFQTIFLRRSQKDKATQVTNVFGVIREICVQLEVEIDIEIDGADDREAIGVPLLVDDQQT
jgi:hypothetical protein